MLSLLLGLAVLIGGLVLLKSFILANPALIAQRVRQLGGIAALGAAGWMMVRGGYQLAFPLGLFGYWLLSNHGFGLPGGGGRSWGTPGRTSSITTDHLEMELDHDTGAMHGRVLKGFFAGRTIQNLRPVELAHLWQDCRFVDPQSAQLIEAYLDRLHPSWRDDMARDEASAPRSDDGRMSRAEALEILGLAGSPSEEQVRQAHRELIVKLHPDRGGSTFLAAKVNEAKDVLLGRSEPPKS